MLLRFTRLLAAPTDGNQASKETHRSTRYLELTQASTVVVPTVDEVDPISAPPDPIIRNLKITQCYYELSCSMRELVGRGAKSIARPRSQSGSLSFSATPCPSPVGRMSWLFARRCVALNPEQAVGRL